MKIKAEYISPCHIQIKRIWQAPRILDWRPPTCPLGIPMIGRELRAANCNGLLDQIRSKLAH